MHNTHTHAASYFMGVYIYIYIYIYVTGNVPNPVLYEMPRNCIKCRKAKYGFQFGFKFAWAFILYNVTHNAGNVLNAGLASRKKSVLVLTRIIIYILILRDSSRKIYWSFLMYWFIQYWARLWKLRDLKEMGQELCLSRITQLPQFLLWINFCLHIPVKVYHYQVNI
jgi:hypothetical protein